VRRLISGRAASSAALLLLALASIPGCRDRQPLAPSGSPLPFHLTFNPGDAFGYDVWKVNSYGNTILSSRVRHVLKVRATGVQHQGFSDVVEVLDSAIVVPRGAVPDTLFFRSLSTGEIYEFRFMARLIGLLEGRIVKDRWDKIASFSGGVSSTWTVGTSDSAALEPVYGEILRDQVYIQATVNQTLTLFPAYRIDVTGTTLYCSLLLADDPPSIPYMRWETAYPAGVASGEVWILTDVVNGAQ